jgi:DNA-binding transcriptional LysR family regulator
MKTNLNNTSAFRHFDWNKAKTFYYVAQLGSFTKASDFLHISQPALSRQIQGLERSLGYPLFIREPKGVTLNRKGDELLAIVEDTFSRLSVFTSKDKVPLERGKTRTIRIGIEIGYEYLVMHGLESYQKAHLYLTFEIVQDIPEKSLQVLDLDMAFRGYGAYAYDLNDYAYWKIGEAGKYICVGDITIIASKMNNAFPQGLYMVIPSSSKDDKELNDLYEHLKKEKGI